MTRAFAAAHVVPLRGVVAPAFQREAALDGSEIAVLRIFERRLDPITFDRNDTRSCVKRAKLCAGDFEVCDILARRCGCCGTCVINRQRIRAARKHRIR